MLAERYKRHRYEVGKAEGKAEGIKEGIKEGSKKAKRYASKIRAWNERRIEAAERGEPFDEPMPEYDDDEDVA